MRLGTFKGAVALDGLKSFRDFPAAVQQSSTLDPRHVNAAGDGVTGTANVTAGSNSATVDGNSNVNSKGNGKGNEAQAQGQEEDEVPVVMFCTGGVRCEKAAFALEQKGFKPKNLYQLNGGILHYLQMVGPDYYEGDM